MIQILVFLIVDEWFVCLNRCMFGAGFYRSNYSKSSVLILSFCILFPLSIWSIFVSYSMRVKISYYNCEFVHFSLYFLDKIFHLIIFAFNRRIRHLHFVSTDIFGFIWRSYYYYYFFVCVCCHFLYSYLFSSSPHLTEWIVSCIFYFFPFLYG